MVTFSLTIRDAEQFKELWFVSETRVQFRDEDDNQKRSDGRFNIVSFSSFFSSKQPPHSSQSGGPPPPPRGEGSDP